MKLGCFNPRARGKPAHSGASGLPRAARRLLLWLALTLSAVPAAAEVFVLITSPPPGEAIFDRVLIAAEVSSPEPVGRVEIIVDGVLAGTLHRPPWALYIDAGTENRDHTIEVIAHAHSGALGRARLLAPRLQVHDALALDLQQLYVTVTGRDGHRVLDLPRDAFHLLDEGRPQRLVTFERDDVAFTAAILIDGSGSMKGRRLAASLTGAQRFVSDMRPLDEARLMVFSDRLLEITPWSRSAEPIDRALDTVAAEGGTAVFDYLYMALTQLETRHGRRVVVLLTDGWDIQSVLTAEQLLAVARRSQALIYWVRLAGDEPGVGRVLGGLPRVPLQRVRLLPISSWHDETSARHLYRTLGKIVRGSGGRVVTVRGSGGIETAFAEILAELREQYALGYYPEPRRNDGSWREVEVEVEGRGLKIRTREGYVDR